MFRRLSRRQTAPPATIEPPEPVAPPEPAEPIALAAADTRAGAYFMDSPTEGDRLEAKTDPMVVGRHLLMTGLRQGMRALDAACGSGAATRVMAKIAGPGLVTGVDFNPARLEQARILAERAGVAIDFARAAADALPFADAGFDYTHARMLFQYLAEPEAALAELVRVTRPGGTIVLIDLDGQLEQLYPMPQQVAEDLQEALRILGARGFDPHVGRKLATLCAHAGLSRIRTWIEPYQMYSGGALTESALRNWREKLATATGFLAGVTGDTVRWQIFREAYLHALTAEDAFYYASVVIVCAEVPVSLRQDAHAEGGVQGEEVGNGVLDGR
jgi:ubiquinone/menaquinone biosynthesis C-methylase UbiE